MLTWDRETHKPTCVFCLDQLQYLSGVCVCAQMLLGGTGVGPKLMKGWGERGMNGWGMRNGGEAGWGLRDEGRSGWGARDGRVKDEGWRSRERRMRDERMKREIWVMDGEPWWWDGTRGVETLGRGAASLGVLGFSVKAPKGTSVWWYGQGFAACKW